MLKLNRLVVSLVLTIPLLIAVLQAQPIQLSIFHTNDTHGHLLPFSYPAFAPPGTDLAALKVKRDIGGIARRVSLFHRLRAELERKGTTVWLVDAGDFCDGTSFSTEYHGEADVAAMNAAGYTFATLGNHEFNNSLPALKNLLGRFSFPVLCANVVETSTGKPLVQPSLIREIGPLKIGIFGLVVREAGSYQAGKEGLLVSEELATARAMVETLRREADIVIALSHAGQKTDLLMGETLQGLDVIVGGHSHSRLADGEFLWHSEELRSDDVNGTIIVQAHQWGGELGQLDLLFDRDEKGAWHVTRYRARLIPVTSDIPEDPQVAAVVNRYWTPIAARYGEIIGQAADDFTLRDHDLAHYNLVTDLVREVYGSEIQLENMGGIRAPLIKGKITREDLVTMDPFDNTVVTFKVTGRQLKEILQLHRPAVSGIRYRAENGQITEVTVGGQPLAEDRLYTGTSNSFFAERALQGIEYVNTGKIRREIVLESIRKKGTVKPLYDARRVVLQLQAAAP